MFHQVRPLTSAHDDVPRDCNGFKAATLGHHSTSSIPKKLKGISSEIGSQGSAEASLEKMQKLKTLKAAEVTKLGLSERTGSS